MTNGLIKDLIPIIKKTCPNLFKELKPGEIFVVKDEDQKELTVAANFLLKLVPMVDVVIGENERMEAMNKRLSNSLVAEMAKVEGLRMRISELEENAKK